MRFRNVREVDVLTTTTDRARDVAFSGAIGEHGWVDPTAGECHAAASAGTAALEGRHLTVPSWSLLFDGFQLRRVVRVEGAG